MDSTSSDTKVSTLCCSNHRCCSSGDLQRDPPLYYAIVTRRVHYRSSTWPSISLLLFITASIDAESLRAYCILRAWVSRCSQLTSHHITSRVLVLITEYLTTPLDLVRLLLLVRLAAKVQPHELLQILVDVRCQWISV